MFQDTVVQAHTTCTKTGHALTEGITSTRRAGFGLLRSSNPARWEDVVVVVFALPDYCFCLSRSLGTTSLMKSPPSVLIKQQASDSDMEISASGKK